MMIAATTPPRMSRPQLILGIACLLHVLISERRIIERICRGRNGLSGWNRDVQLADGWRRSTAPLRAAGGDDAQTCRARLKMHDRFARECDGSHRVLRARIEEGEVVAGYLKVEKHF